jgi:hypothetical protein
VDESSNHTPFDGGRNTEQGPAFSIEDTILLLSKAEEGVLFDITLVGGQALNFWADRLLTNGGDFLSGDVDFLGSAESADICAQCWHAEASFRKASLDDAMGSPNTAVILVPRVANGIEVKPLRVDFLGNIIGPSAREVVRSRFEINTIRGVTFFVMHPFHVMESRLENAFYLKRKDELSMGRLRLSFAVLRQHIADTVADDPRDALDIVEQVFDLAQTQRGKEAWRAGFDVLDTIPISSQDNEESLWPDGFVKIRWPQMQNHLQAKRSKFEQVMLRIDAFHEQKQSSDDLDAPDPVMPNEAEAAAKASQTLSVSINKNGLGVT